jgi:alanine racemase
VIPVVKADAYGHGALPVARALERGGADGLAVAVLDEALELRRGGIVAPIVVLYPVPPDGAVQAAAASIEVTLGDAEASRRVLEAVRRGLDHPLGVHLEIETGLGRGGVPPEELPGLLAQVRAQPAVRLVGLWSHLTAGDDAPRTAAQADVLDRAARMLGGAGDGQGVVRHMAASAGILAGSGPALDAVRPGLSIYGLVPEELIGGEAGEALRPAMALYARPVRVAVLPAGHGVGYGPAFTTTRSTRVATLSLGYGDGYARTMSHRVSAIVRGRRVPIIGTIAMDALMADVTDVPGEPVTPDDEFVLLGEQGNERIDVYELARSRTTISWEVITAMSPRLPRVYHAAAGLLVTRTLSGEQDARGSDRALER